MVSGVVRRREPLVLLSSNIWMVAAAAGIFSPRVSAFPDMAILPDWGTTTVRSGSMPFRTNLYISLNELAEVATW